MLWSTVRINKLFPELSATFLRKAVKLAVLGAMSKPLNDLHDRILYKMQHDGHTIYLEKMLNEYFGIAGYNHQNHESTKKVYIDDIEVNEKLFIFQNEEPESTFLEDDGADVDTDIFLDGDGEGIVLYSWTIYVPDTIDFQEEQLRSKVDEYRYFGKKYTIQTYTL